MKYILCLIIVFLFSTRLFSQVVVESKNSKRIEVTPYVRFDKYPAFSYVIENRFSTDEIKINSTSWGISAAYKFRLSNSFLIKPILGYYKFSFNNINRENTAFGHSDVRHINYPSPFLILFYSDKYFYNTISAGVAAEKIFPVKKHYQFAVGGQLYNYITFSQHYHLDFNPGGSQDDHRNQFSYFGVSGALYINFVRKFKSIDIGPSLTIPIVTSWRTDSIFPEEDGKHMRTNFFNSIGVGLSINFSPKK
jgi:hypothetical protein